MFIKLDLLEIKKKAFIYEHKANNTVIAKQISLK